MWAKQSSAATLIVGPILDSTGAEYTSAVIGDLSISKNGGTLTALAAAATLTHIANGQYTLVMTTGNLDTLGRLQISCNKSTYQMPPIGLVVVPAMVFDSMVLGTDVLQSDVTQFGGTAGTFAAGIPTVVLDSPTQTQIDNIEATLTTLGSESTTVERSVSDTNAITFSWPVSGATITGTASLNNGTYGAVAGAIAFLRTETGRHYYTLAYNAADRPSAEGQVRYKFVDGTYTGYVVLRTVTTVLADAAHGGAAATLVLSTIDIQPASADTPGVLIRGTGYAAGIDVKGGEYADGIKARSGDTSGYGICSNGVQGGARFWSTNGYGVRVSSDNSNAFSIYGGTYAFQINSVNNAIDVYSSTGNAVYLQSAQNDAVVIYPGADDIGVHIWGGQTSGDAVALSSNGTGSVFYPIDLSGLNDLSAADVNAEVVDVLSVDTFAELTAPPAATSSLKDKITWLFMYARNKVTQTSSQRKLYRDDTTTVAGTSGTSDNGTTFTKGEDS